MATENFKIESGLQVLARLSKTSDTIEFYPYLFSKGLKNNAIVEISGENNCGKSLLLVNIACEALMPTVHKGIEANVIIFNTDGNFSLKLLLRSIRKKINTYTSSEETNTDLNEEKFSRVLERIYFIDIFNSVQFYSSIQNLETILSGLQNTTLILFDTLVAYYWSEQVCRISRMDTYIINIIKMIQNVTKEQRVVIFYTKPCYFNSKLDNVTVYKKESIDYKITVSHFLNSNSETQYKVMVNALHYSYVKTFYVTDNNIKWLN